MIMIVIIIISLQTFQVVFTKLLNYYIAIHESLYVIRDIPDVGKVDEYERDDDDDEVKEIMVVAKKKTRQPTNLANLSLIILY